jgi:lipid-A-disaccharide synthase-like uncharacterized protein
MNNTLIYSIGFLAQILFSARMIVQWIQSEKAGEVLSPTLFWQFSLAGSLLLIIYGVLRMDVVIAGGQFVLYYIYIRNLALKKALFGKFGLAPILILMVVPIASILWLFSSTDIGFKVMITGRHIPSLLLTWGATGQIIFSFRFVYQWIYSEKKKESILPMGFWVFSLVGSFMLIVYASFRMDPVIFIGQLFGAFVYIRNIRLHFKQPRYP